MWSFGKNIEIKESLSKEKVDIIIGYDTEKEVSFGSLVIEKKENGEKKVTSIWLKK